MLVLPAGFLDPIRETVLLGQVNLLVALLVIADMTLDLRLPRGVLVGLAAAIKITPVILIPYLFLTRQTKAGLRATGVFAAAAAVAAAVSPMRHGGTGLMNSGTRPIPGTWPGSATKGSSASSSGRWGTS